MGLGWPPLHKLTWSLGLGRGLDWPDKGVQRVSASGNGAAGEGITYLPRKNSIQRYLNIWYIFKTRTNLNKIQLFDMQKLYFARGFGLLPFLAGGFIALGGGVAVGEGSVRPNPVSMLQVFTAVLYSLSLYSSVIDVNIGINRALGSRYILRSKQIFCLFQKPNRECSTIKCSTVPTYKFFKHTQR